MKLAKLLLMLGAWVLLTNSLQLSAHCDSMDGPVIKDAQRALNSGDITPVLKWVTAEDEATVKQVFKLTTSVRTQSPSAREVADSYFFETLVRIHRASEGEGFRGIKSAGSVEPAIAATDRALAEGNIDQLADKVAAAVRKGITTRFDTALARKVTAEESVSNGRDYVESYVQLTHFVEAIHQTVSHGASHQHQE